MTKTEWLKACENYGWTELLERAYDNIMANESRGDVPWSPYRAFRPGRGTWFDGIWNWDSAFHAMCLGRWDTQLAKESILSFIQFQCASGMYPDVIHLDGKVEDISSKPPVMATYALLTYQRSGDKDFLSECFHSLRKNLAFWETYRQAEGLFFYDANTDDAEIKDEYVRWESGWDDSVRWDVGIENLYPIDLQCYMIMFYRAMDEMARLLEESGEDWQQKSEELAKKVNAYFYDEENGVYVDIFKTDKKYSSIYSPASFMPLYIGIASQERAYALAQFAQAHFYPAMPTVAYDDPAYTGDYWRGHTWLNVAYFAIKGLKNYGFNELADEMRNTLLTYADKNKDGIYEKYDADTGEGKRCPCFSWSSAFIIEFVLNF